MVAHPVHLSGNPGKEAALTTEPKKAGVGTPSMELQEKLK